VESLDELSSSVLYIQEFKDNYVNSTRCKGVKSFFLCFFWARDEVFFVLEENHKKEKQEIKNEEKKSLKNSKKASNDLLWPRRG
jgi:penicillin-binding protein-related factor A (putative recombinase)